MSRPPCRKRVQLPLPKSLLRKLIHGYLSAASVLLIVSNIHPTGCPLIDIFSTIWRLVEEQDESVHRHSKATLTRSDHRTISASLPKRPSATVGEGTSAWLWSSPPILLIIPTYRR